LAKSLDKLVDGNGTVISLLVIGFDRADYGVVTIDYYVSFPILSLGDIIPLLSNLGQFGLLKFNGFATILPVVYVVKLIGEVTVDD